MGFLNAIPLPIRVALMFVLPLLLVQWLAPYAPWLVALAVVLVVLTLTSLLYANGSLNALARVPLLSGLLDRLVAGRSGTVSGAGGASVAAPAASKALSDAERDRLYADGMQRLHGLVGIDEAVDTVERRIVDVARAGASTGDRGFGVKAPALVVIVSGPRGVGKSEVARAVAEIYAGLGALETARIVRLREQDIRGSYSASPSALARDKCLEALDGALLLDDADWLVSDTAGLDVGLAILDAALDQPQRMLVLLTMSESGERRLRGDADHARWLGKLAIRPVPIAPLEDDDLVQLLEARLGDAGASLDPAARGAAKSMLRDERERLGRDGFDNAIACSRIADRLIETSMARAPDGDGPAGARQVTRDDLRVVLDSH